MSKDNVVLSILQLFLFYSKLGVRCNQVFSASLIKWKSFNEEATFDARFVQHGHVLKLKE